MDEFAAEVRAFLDASAPRRPGPAQAVAWGEGADQIAYFSTDPPDVDRANADRARQWQRRRFDAFDYMTAGKLRFTTPTNAPDENELGWKDTVRANSKTLTRIIVPFVGYPGRYVWHCHILEHEENEMMRPFEVLSA